MHRSRRAWGLLSSLLASAVVGVIVLPGAASAKSHGTAPQKVTCSAVGYLPGGLSLGGCTPTLQTGGSGSFSVALAPSQPSASGSGTITWNGAGTTTVAWRNGSRSPYVKNKCPLDPTNPGAHENELILRGSVTANTPVGMGNAGVKGALQAKICLSLHGTDWSLLAGSLFKI